MASSVVMDTSGSWRTPVDPVVMNTSGSCSHGYLQVLYMHPCIPSNVVRICHPVLTVPSVEGTTRVGINWERARSVNSALAPVLGDSQHRREYVAPLADPLPYRPLLPNTLGLTS